MTRKQAKKKAVAAIRTIIVAAKSLGEAEAELLKLDDEKAERREPEDCRAG